MHAQYPVTATQWHPEKNAFEFPRHLHIPHSSQAVRLPSKDSYLSAVQLWLLRKSTVRFCAAQVELTHAVAKFLVDSARRSSHAPVLFSP
jgi:gamma-glutamyl hydrolase